MESVFADQIEEGDRLVSWKGEETVVGVEVAREKGIWTPLTMEGTLLVDGLLASSYASFSHRVSEMAYAPIKMFPRLLLDDEASQHQDGCRQVVKLLKKVGVNYSKDAKGTSCLHIAIMRGNLAIVDFLLTRTIKRPMEGDHL